jgi:hypothetical protein
MPDIAPNLAACFNLRYDHQEEAKYHLSGDSTGLQYSLDQGPSDRTFAFSAVPEHHLPNDGERPRHIMPPIS